MTNNRAVPIYSTPVISVGGLSLPRTRTLVVAIFLIGLLPLLSTPLLPFIDLYNHLARYFVLSHLDDSALLRQNYEANWSLLPNIGLDVIGTLVLRFLPPALAAHVAVIGIFAVQYSGILYFNRALTGRTSPLVALLIVPLLYSFILNWGFANFLFGLGLVFWAAGWWLSQRHRLAVALPVACLFAVLIFLAHGLTFALYGILVGTLEIGLFLQRKPKRVGALVGAMIPLLVQAVIPVAMFALTTTSHSQGGLTNADESIGRLSAAGHLSARLWDLFCYRMTTIVRVEEGPVLWLDIATFVLQAAIIGLLLSRGRLQIARPAWPAIIVGAILVVIMPPALFGVGYVADRMPLFLAMIVVGALKPRLRGDALDIGAVAVLALVVAARLAAIAIGWQGYAADYAEFRAVAAQVPPGMLVDDVIVGGSHHDSDRPRCQMYRPLMVSLFGQIGPLFANETQQPLRLVGPLRKAVDALPGGFAWGNLRQGYYDDVIADSGRAGFRYLLICNAGLLTRPFPANSRVVTQTSSFTLLRLGA